MSEGDLCHPAHGGAGTCLPSALQPPVVMDGGGHSPGGGVAVYPSDSCSCFLSPLTKTPTLILYGDHDTGLAPQALQNLQHLPKHRVAVLSGAGHACYLDKPEEFHRALLGFLRQLK